MRPREVVEACHEAWQNRDVETAAKLTSPNLVEHSPILVVLAHELSQTGESAQSKHPPIQDIQNFLEVFPDATATIDDIFEANDRVVYRWTGSGTHKGDFMGIAASGKTVTVEGMTIARVENDQIVETWRQFDFMGALAQLGLDSKALALLRSRGGDAAQE